MKKLNFYNEKYGYDITYFESKLNPETSQLAKGYDVVCIFVNDNANAEALKVLEENGVKCVALRCAGFNNVDLANKGNLRVVRVPQYSPYSVAEHAVALLLNINRKIYKSYQRTKKYNFSIDGLLGFDVHGKTVGVIGTGKIGGVGLDVYEDEEEYFLRDLSNEYRRDKDLSILLSMPNVLITSHQAFFTQEAINKIASDTLENVTKVINNEECENELK